MSDEKPKVTFSIEGFDPLGLKSAGEISKEIVQLGIDGVKEFLKLTCKPLLEELGLGLRDKYSNWRLLNIVKMLEVAQGKLAFDFEKEKLVIDPRVAYQIAEHASVIGNNTLQQMWGGLFASSCQSYEEDENIFFIDILKRLTSSQVKLLNYLCEQSPKTIGIANLLNSKEDGLIFTGLLKINYDEIMAIMETTHKLKADTELSALVSMGLIELHNSSNQQNLPIAFKIKSSYHQGLKPSIITISLYVKCQGSKQTPFEYFLPQITDYFYELLKDYIKVEKSEILTKAFEISQIGKGVDEELTLSPPTISFKSESWAKLPLQDITDRLRGYLIFKHITGLSREYKIQCDQKDFGTFTYTGGFIQI